jgi:hypothetical protein
MLALCVTPPVLWAAAQTSPQDAAAVARWRAFQCPEALTSNEAKESALREFMRAYAAENPNNSVRDMMSFRYRLLVAHACTQTLISMLATVSPLSETLHIEGRDFGPRTEEFDKNTKVWTVWFRKNGEPPGHSNENVIFNFYGWNPPIAPEVIAKSFVSPRENVQILGRFRAPDDITKQPAYFVVSESLYPGETYGYVSISKITSAGSSAYTVTFTKVIAGPSTEDVDKKVRAWLISAEGKAFSEAIGHVGVDPDWEQHLAHAHK